MKSNFQLFTLDGAKFSLNACSYFIGWSIYLICICFREAGGETNEEILQQRNLLGQMKTTIENTCCKVNQVGDAGTVQSLYNTPYYNTNLDIAWS